MNSARYDSAMLSAGDQRRIREFSRYSANLTVYVSKVSDVFVCPVCLQPFTKADVLHENLKVDIGHIYPEEVGGNLTTLECRACNARLNRAGDNELVRLHKQWDAMGVDPKADPIKGFIEMPSGRVGIDVTGNGIHAHWTRAHPTAFEEARRALLNHTPVRITLPGVREAEMNLGILHSAHLLLFRSFAYGYLRTPAGKFIQNILHKSEQLDKPPFMTMEIPVTGGVDARILYRAGICTLPGRERCLFVALPVADPKSLCQLVLLPGLWADDIQKYQRIYGLGERWLTARFVTLDRGPRERLSAAEYANCLDLLWGGWTNRNIDRTKVMNAIRVQVCDSIVRKVDAAAIGNRFGIRGSYLSNLIRALSTDGFLQRMPKRDRPHLVRLTAKAISAAPPPRPSLSGRRS